MSKFSNEKINKLSAYVPGEQPKDKKYIKLNTNESPFPPSPLAVRLAKKELKKVRLYPDPDCSELISEIAKTVGVKSENVIVSNGSDEVLNFAFIAYADENTPAIFPDISYGFYKVFAGVNGVPYEEIALKDDFSLDISDYEGKKGVVFIANPNAPTGLEISLEDIEKLLSSNPERVVVIDEAYVDFGGISATSLIEKYDNLLVTQTFSKSRSMAGARLGFGVASEKIIEDLKKVKYSTNPYNVNRVTAVMGVGALRDSEYFSKNVNAIINNRAYTIEELSKLGFTCTNSKTNFVFAKCDKISGEELYLKLKDKGILVRHFNKDRISDYIRVTVGSLAEMKAFVTAVQEILGAKI
ncbi:MAG: histidinol-phosphate transaminase [Clostridia bacterium]|nr:histidinol-phosphate transaminase [Clostridia bacterium]